MKICEIWEDLEHPDNDYIFKYDLMITPEEHNKLLKKIMPSDAIKALEMVEEFKKAHIITGGRLNGRTYAYKCGLEDGKRKALEQMSKPRKGEWLRMSDLSEQEDDRYKCSRCGNVIHHKNKMDLYTFNSWCGRCGSNNSRHITDDLIKLFEGEEENNG